MQKKLVLADTDERYIRRLCRELRRREQLPAGVQIITEEKYLEEYLQTHEADWVFLAENMLNDRVRELAGERMTLLTEEEEKEKCGCILKFQPVDVLVEKIISVLPGRKTVSECEYLAVYPSDGGIPGSLYGLSLAVFLGNYGSVLYLNLDCFCPFRKFWPEFPGGTLSDWMFHYRQGLLSEEERRTFVPWNKITVVLPPVCPEDCDDLKKLDLAAFVRTISEKGQFDWVVCQLGESPVQALELLDICRALYVPGNGAEWHSERSRELLSYFEQTYGSDYSSLVFCPELPQETLPQITEEAFEEAYRTVWRDYIWERLRTDRIL